MNLKSEEPEIKVEIEKIKQFGDKNVRFIILYGSSVKRKLTDMSDIDIAVFFQGTKKERFDFRKKILGRVNNRFDIQTFQDLPLYIQNNIISTGKIIYFRDYRETFEIFMKTIREFSDFKPRLEIYYSGLGV